MAWHYIHIAAEAKKRHHAKISTAQAIIYVVDSCDADRLPTSREEFQVRWGAVLRQWVQSSSSSSHLELIDHYPFAALSAL